MALARTPMPRFLMSAIVERAQGQYAAHSNGRSVNATGNADLKGVLQDFERKVVGRHDSTTYHAAGG